MAIKYLIGHWTGGNHTPNAIDLSSYQWLVKYNGEIVKGQSKTASTGGMNSITENIACCGGLSRTPLTKKQCEAFFKHCAKRLKALKLTAKEFYTHAEIGEMVKNKTITKLLPWNNYLSKNISKVDLTVLPYNLEGKSHGDFIRNKIHWYFERI